MSVLLQLLVVAECFATATGLLVVASCVLLQLLVVAECVATAAGGS